MARIHRFGSGLGSSFGPAALVSSLAILALAGCQPSEQAPQPRPRPRPPGPTVQPPETAAPSAAAYMASAASIDLVEIQSSQMALTRARNPRHREFAAMMIRAHNGTSAQLSLAGRRLNLLPPATLQPKHQAMLAELSASADFDGTYHRQQIAIHEEALSLHGAYAKRGASPTLRPVAVNAVPIVRRHLEMLRAM